MKSITKNIIIIFILILLFLKRPFIISSTIESFEIWKSSIFPSIFPIMIISDFIISTNLITIISNILGPIFKKIFKVSKYASYVFIMSMISGTPSNAKYINDLYLNKVIDKEEVIKILSMTLLYNPLLIITITPYLNFNDRIYLIISNICANIIIGTFNRNVKTKDCNIRLDKKNFNLVNSISNGINTLLLILGALITFNILNNILPIKHPLITGALEITNGFILINHSFLLYKYKFIFTAILLSFGGLSIITQIKSIFKDTNLDYSLFYKSRVIHLLLMILFSYLKFIFL